MKVNNAIVKKATYDLSSCDSHLVKFNIIVCFIIGKGESIFTCPLRSSIIEELFFTFKNDIMKKATLDLEKVVDKSVAYHHVYNECGSSVTVSSSTKETTIKMIGAPGDEIIMSLSLLIKNNKMWDIPVIKTTDFEIKATFPSPVQCTFSQMTIMEEVSEIAGESKMYTTFRYTGKSPQKLQFQQNVNHCVLTSNESFELVKPHQRISGISLNIDALDVNLDKFITNPIQYGFIWDVSGSMATDVDGVYRPDKYKYGIPSKNECPRRLDLLKTAGLSILQNIQLKDDDTFTMASFDTRTRFWRPQFLSELEFHQQEYSWTSFMENLEHYGQGTDLVQVIDKFLYITDPEKHACFFIFTDGDTSVHMDYIESVKSRFPLLRFITVALSDQATMKLGDDLASTGGISLHLSNDDLMGDGIYLVMNQILHMVLKPLTLSTITIETEVDLAGVKTMDTWTSYASIVKPVVYGQRETFSFLGPLIDSAKITITTISKNILSGEVLCTSVPEIVDINHTINRDVMKSIVNDVKIKFVLNNIIINHNVMTMKDLLLFYELQHRGITKWYCLGFTDRPVHNFSFKYDSDEDRCNMGISSDEFDNDSNVYRGSVYTSDHNRSNGDEEDDEEKTNELIALSISELTITDYVKWIFGGTFLDRKNPFNPIIFLTISQRISSLFEHSQLQPNLVSNVIVWILSKNEFDKDFYMTYEISAKKSLEKIGVFEKCEQLEENIKLILQL